MVIHIKFVLIRELYKNYLKSRSISNSDLFFVKLVKLKRIEKKLI